MDLVSTKERFLVTACEMPLVVSVALKPSVGGMRATTETLTRLINLR